MAFYFAYSSVRTICIKNRIQISINKEKNKNIYFLKIFKLFRKLFIINYFFFNDCMLKSIIILFCIEHLI